MPDRLSLKFAGAAFLFAACMSVSSPARAGFQWVAPGDAVEAPPAGMPQALSPAPSFVPSSSAPEIISPVVITGAAPAPRAAPAPQAVPAPQVAPLSEFSFPPPAAAAPQAIVPTTMTLSAPVPAQDKSVVIGFAKSVPLAVALRQILPGGYAFTIDQDVDMGTLVSFQGGRAWRDTLRDTLDPVGLVAREQGQMVVVSFVGKGLVPPPATSADARVAPSSSPSYQAGMEPRTLTLSAPPPEQPSLPTPAVSPLSISGSAPVSVSESWSAERGESLRKVLEGWAHRSNVEFDWFSEYDYPLEASVSFAGTFENAVRSLLTGFEGAHPQPVAELHSNAALGQMVLVVQTRGNTNSD